MWPTVRALLTQSGLDPLTITATGPHGMLVKGDVLAAMGLCAPPLAPAAAHEPNVVKASAATASPAAAATTAAAAAAPKSAPAAKAAKAATAAATPGVVNEFEDLPVTNIRKVIAGRLLASKTQNPHEYVTAEVSLAGVAALRAQLKKAGVKASVNDCVVYAAARALAASPKINATWDNAKGVAVFHPTVDIAIAVATPGGLITPIVTGADGKSLTAIGGDIRELAGRAREGKLKPHEFMGGSFSISNLGMFPVDQFSAILNPPQGAIMAVGRGVDKVVLGSDGQPTDSPVMSVTVSADARVADAADVARFVEVFREHIEKGAASWVV